MHVCTDELEDGAAHPQRSARHAGGQPGAADAAALLHRRPVRPGLVLHDEVPELVVLRATAAAAPRSSETTTRGVLLNAPPSPLPGTVRSDGSPPRLQPFRGGRQGSTRLQHCRTRADMPAVAQTHLVLLVVVGRFFLPGGGCRHVVLDEVLQP